MKGSERDKRGSGLQGQGLGQTKERRRSMGSVGLGQRNLGVDLSLSGREREREAVVEGLVKDGRSGRKVPGGGGA